VVFDNATAQIKSWRLPTDYGAVAWTAEQAIRVFESTLAAGGGVHDWPALHHVFIDVAVDARAAKLIDLIEKTFHVTDKVPVIAFGFSRNATQPSWADRLVLDPADSAALVRAAKARTLYGIDDLSVSLRRIWDNGARLTGNAEDSQSGSDAEKKPFNLEVEVVPRDGAIALYWSSGNVRNSVRLSLGASGLQESSPFVERRYDLSHDGVTLRAEQRDVWIRFVGTSIGRLLAKLSVSDQSFELKEEKIGWTVEISRQNALGRSRRLRVLLTDVSRLSASSRSL
jgi:hypothetical protein